jgi:glycogen synthase
VTVSPGYAKEIQSWVGGWGLEGLLAQRSYVLNGIVNGICMDEWNPAEDRFLAANYNASNFRWGCEGRLRGGWVGGWVGSRRPVWAGCSARQAAVRGATAA